jgi:hypothetical protein
MNCHIFIPPSVGALDMIVTNKEREDKELGKALMHTGEMSYDEYGKRFSEALKQFEEGIRCAVWLNENERRKLKAFSEELFKKWRKCKELVWPGEIERELLEDVDDEVRRSFPDHEEPVEASKDAEGIKRWVVTKLRYLNGT